MEAKEGELWGQKGAFVQMDYPTMKSESKENCFNASFLSRGEYTARSSTKVLMNALYVEKGKSFSFNFFHSMNISKVP